MRKIGKGIWKVYPILLLLLRYTPFSSLFFLNIPFFLRFISSSFFFLFLFFFPLHFIYSNNKSFNKIKIKKNNIFSNFIFLSPSNLLYVNTFFVNPAIQSAELKLTSPDHPRNKSTTYIQIGTNWLLFYFSIIPLKFFISTLFSCVMTSTTTNQTSSSSLNPTLPTNDDTLRIYKGVNKASSHVITRHLKRKMELMVINFALCDYEARNILSKFAHRLSCCRCQADVELHKSQTLQSIRGLLLKNLIDNSVKATLHAKAKVKGWKHLRRRCEPNFNTHKSLERAFLNWYKEKLPTDLGSYFDGHQYDELAKWYLDQLLVLQPITPPTTPSECELYDDLEQRVRSSFVLRLGLLQLNTVESLIVTCRKLARPLWQSWMSLKEGSCFL